MDITSSKIGVGINIIAVQATGAQTVLQLTKLCPALLALAACNNANPSCAIRDSDRAIVNRALDAYGKGKISRETVLGSSNVQVVYLPHMTCIGFNLKHGTVGGDETLCFDDDGRQVLSYTNGQ
jgi:hypothetical protein